MASSPSTNSISSLSQNKTQETEGELADDKESEPTLDLDSLLDDSVESRISASYHSNNSDGLNPSRWDRRTTSPRKEKSLVCFKSPPLPPIPSYLQKSCQQHKQNLNEMLLNVLDCLPTSIISEILMQYLHPPIVHACKGCEKSRFIEEFPISTQKRIEKLYTPRETGEYDWMTPEMLKPTHTLSPRAFCSQCYNSVRRLRASQEVMAASFIPVRSTFTRLSVLFQFILLTLSAYHSSSLSLSSLLDTLPVFPFKTNIINMSDLFITFSASLYSQFSQFLKSLFDGFLPESIGSEYLYSLYPYLLEILSILICLVTLYELHYEPPPPYHLYRQRPPGSDNSDPHTSIATANSTQSNHLSTVYLFIRKRYNMFIEHGKIVRKKLRNWKPSKEGLTMLHIGCVLMMVLRYHLIYYLKQLY